MARAEPLRDHHASGQLTVEEVRRKDAIGDEDDAQLEEGPVCRQGPDRQDYARHDVGASGR